MRKRRIYGNQFPCYLRRIRLMRSRGAFKHILSKPIFHINNPVHKDQIAELISWVIFFPSLSFKPYQAEYSSGNQRLFLTLATVRKQPSLLIDWCFVACRQHLLFLRQDFHGSSWSLSRNVSEPGRNALHPVIALTFSSFDWRRLIWAP